MRTPLPIVFLPLVLGVLAGCPGETLEKCEANPNLLDCLIDTDPDGPGDSGPKDSEPADSQPVDSGDSTAPDPCVNKGGDSDGDGVCDDDDPCPTIKNDNDTDGDGVCDSVDPCPLDNPDDSDGDGVCDSNDACPNDALDDSDGDGVCDSDDPCPKDRLDDRDGDGVCDSDDPCPLDNPDDPDGDNICSSDDPCPNNAGSSDSSDCDTGETGVLVPHPEDLAVGGLVITEVMVNPASCSANQFGQYLEVKNVSGLPLNLSTLKIAYTPAGGSTATVSVTADLFVPDGEYAVLRPNWVQISTCKYTGLTADYLYSTQLQFQLAGGVVSVRDVDGRVIDQVDLGVVGQGGGGLTTVDGYAIHIDTDAGPNRESSDANDLKGAWCLAGDPIGGNNFGSPGGPGVGCAEIVVESGDSGTVDSEIPESKPPTGTVFKPPASGDLLLTEVMLRPKDCGVTPSRGRYVELLNTTAQWLTLDGVELDWGTAEGIRIFPKPGNDLYVAPGERFVIHSMDGSLQTCHGVSHSFRMFHPLSSEPRRLRVREGLTVVEDVDFGGAGWTGFPLGAALGFDPTLEAQPTLNTNRLNWCPQEDLLPNQGFDLGTPNRANSTCDGGPGTDPEPVETDIPASCLDNVLRNPADNGLDAAELCEGDLVVTEVMFDPVDCGVSEAQYLEVYNASGVAVRPVGLKVVIDDPFTTAVPNDLELELKLKAGSTVNNTIAPGAYAAFVLPSDTTYCYAFLRNFDLDATAGVDALFPGKLQVTNGTYLVDEVDFSVFSGIPEGRALQLDPEISPEYPANNDNEFAWCADGPTLAKGGTLPVADRGTPGAVNNCTPDVVDTSPVESGGGGDASGPPRDSIWESQPCADTGCIDDSGPDHTGDGNGVIDGDELIYGDLVITEVMFDPTACGGGASAQYIEVYNTTNRPVNPSGVSVDIGTNTAGLVRLRAGATAADVIPAGTYGVISLVSTTPFCFADAGAHHEISRASMPAAPTDVRLYNGNTSSIDTVNLAKPGSTLQTCTGRAVQLAPAAGLSPVANNDLDNWCVSGKRIPGTEDYGSPGAAGSCGSCLIQDSTPDSEDVFDGILRAGDLKAGDLLITEIMDNSRCSQSESDYIEVYNTTEYTIDLKDLRFRQKNDTIDNIRVIPNSYLLPRNGYALITRALTPGVQRCYAGEQPITTFSAFWQLSVGAQDFYIDHVREGLAFTIDDVRTTAASWDTYDDRSKRIGRSMQLNAEKFTLAANNSGASWCPTPVVAGYEIPRRAGNTKIDYGTPGKPNDPCFFVPTESDASIAPPDSDEGPPVDTDSMEPDTAVDLALISPGTLVITEFMVQPTDCSPEYRAEYIEIFNASGNYVDLRYLEVNVGFDVAVIRNRAIIGPQQYAVLRNGRAIESQFCYPQVPVTAKLGTTAVGDHIDEFGNGGAKISISDQTGRVFDEVDYDPFPPVVGKAWELVEAARDTDSNDDLAAWCLAVDRIPGASGDYGTPGKANTCTLDQPPIDPGVRTVSQLQRGDLVITEILPATAEDGCGGSGGAQWFELLNTTDEVVDLLGLDLSNRFDEVRNRVLDHVYVAKGQRVVLGRYRADGRCYGASAAYLYPTMLLTETGDALRLFAGTRIIDEVDFQGWPITPGRSLQLDPSALDADLNDDETAWCAGADADTIAGASVDRGTPGKVNKVCDIYDPGPQDTGPPDGPDPGTCPIVGVAPWAPAGGGLTVDDLAPGSLIVSEVMSGPKDCGDEYAEYIEIYNTLGQEVNLNGLAVQTSTGTFRIASDVYVGPEGYALGLPDTASTCYGLAACATFRYSGLSIADTGTPVRLLNRTNVPIDQIDTSTFAAPIYGASWNLGSANLDADANDAATSWCQSTELIFGAVSDRGSPGEPNQQCGAPDDSDDSYRDTFETDPVVTGEVKVLADLVLGELLISELHVDPRECSDTAGEYIELYNNSTLPIDLNGIVLGNNRDSVTIARQPRRLVIQPGQYMAFRYASVESCYDFTVPVYYTSINLDDARGYFYIGGAGKVLDVVRFADLGPSPGEAWQIDPAHLASVVPGGTGDPIGVTSFTAGYPGYDTANWCPAYYKIPGATGDKGNPGSASKPCLDDTDIVPHTGDYVAHVDEFVPGDLAITEFMADPEDCADLFGEWLELRNDGPYTVDLKGLRIQSGQSSATVKGSVIVPRGEIALVRRSSGLSDCYPGLVPDALVPDMVLPNGSGFVQLANVHSTLDRVDYTIIGTRPGRSLAADPGRDDAVSNDDPLAWCFQPDVFVGAVADRGSPGEANSACVGSVATVPLDQVQVGDLVITELMLKANNCDPNNFDQYIEITNVSGKAIRLLDLRWQVGNFNVEGRIRTRPGTSNPDSIVESGEAFVMKATANFCLPNMLPDGSVWWDYVYSEPFLNPFGGGDVLRITRVNASGGRDILDELDFRPFPDPPGHAYQLQPDSYNTLDNDDYDNWCTTGPRIPRSTTSGTPGELNDCSIDTDPILDTVETDSAGLGYDTGFFDVAVMTVSAQVVPNALFRGQLTRWVARGVPGITAVGEDVDILVVGPRLICAYAWTVTEDQFAPNSSKGRLSTAAICPDCEWGFALRGSGRIDLAGQQLGRPSQCTGQFDAYGGTPVSFNNRRMYGSQRYGGVFIEDAQGSLVPYSYDVVLESGTADWKVILYANPVP
ncbi:MAG: lamin tail domain-containing protein [Alphaproteobacteria bacterium]|nr:lamin tail domain-containing protein [Alphaproteobacteria bacterium]